MDETDTPHGIASERLGRSWLEAQGRLLHPHAIMLRFILVMCCLAALELGRSEGLAVGLALLWNGQCYQLLLMLRVREMVLAGDSGRLSPGSLDVPWVLRGITAHTLRGITTAGLVAAVLYFDPRAGIFALIACHLLTEWTGVMLGRVVDPLVQVEVERRVALLRGFEPPDGSDRGDFRHRG